MFIDFDVTKSYISYWNQTRRSVIMTDTSKVGWNVCKTTGWRSGNGTGYCVSSVYEKNTLPLPTINHAGHTCTSALFLEDCHTTHFKTPTSPHVQWIRPCVLTYICSDHNHIRIGNFLCFMSNFAKIWCIFSGISLNYASCAGDFV